MFEFIKLCNECEKLNPLERGLLLTEKSVSVLAGLNALQVEGVSPVKALAAFIVGAAVSDGVLNEKDYLYIYPSLIKAFGDDFDFLEIKKYYKVTKDVKKELERHTKELMEVISRADEELKADVITLCILITAVDGKITLKEKRYIRQLLKK